MCITVELKVLGEVTAVLVSYTSNPYIHITYLV